jgi:hypothetical protein
VSAAVPNDLILKTESKAIGVVFDRGQVVFQLIFFKLFKLP